MDYLDVILIPIFYWFRTALIFVSALPALLKLILRVSAQESRALFQWAMHACISWLLLLIFCAHRVVHLPLALLMSTTCWTALAFWPRFFWHLFGPSSTGRSFLAVLRNPVPLDGPKPRPKTLACTQEKYCCFLSYQVWGRGAHLHQHPGNPVLQAISVASSTVWHEDPL